MNENYICFSLPLIREGFATFLSDSVGGIAGELLPEVDDILNFKVPKTGNWN
jgi:hypothetical protein